MIRKLTLTASAISAMFGANALTAPANASLLGDTVTVGISSPNQNNFSQTGSTTATADASDAFLLTDGFYIFQVDPFGTGAVITLLDIANPNVTSFAFSSSIENATVIKLSHLWGPEVVTGASIEYDFSFAFGLISDVTFTDNTVDVTLTRNGGASWSIGESVTINLTFTPTEVFAIGGETLEVTRNTGVATQLQNLTQFAWQNDTQLFWPTTAIGDELDVSFDAPSAGLYNLVLNITKAPDYGNYKLFLNGSELADVNGYAAGVELAAIDLGDRSLTAGANTLTLKMTGKNSSSSNYFAGIDFIELRDLSSSP